jgi:hypothetical protein
MIAALASLLLMTQAAPAAGADARLEAFKAACLPDHRAPEKRPAVFAREGWRSTRDADHPMLAEVLRLSRSEMAEDAAEGIDGDLGAWRKDLSGHPVYLVLTTVRSDVLSLTGCYLFDFAAPAIAPEPITVWLQESPAQTIDNVGLTAQIWNVEGIEGVWDLQNSFVAAGSQAANVVGYHGMSIQMTSTVEKAAPAAN